MLFSIFFFSHNDKDHVLELSYWTQIERVKVDSSMDWNISLYHLQFGLEK